MLTGRQAFQGDTVSDVLASVLARDPDLSLLPATLSPRIRALLRRSLEKNPKRRWHAAGDVRIEIEDAVAEGASTLGVSTTVVGGRRKWQWLARTWMVTATVLLVIAGAALSFVYFRPSKTPDEIRFLLSVPFMPNQFAFGLSPDGRVIAFAAVASESSGIPFLFVRQIGSLTPQQLTGTEGATSPFWSPDSRYIGFFAAGKLKKIDLSGGPPVNVCDGPAAGTSQSGTWNREGVILFSYRTVLYRVSAAGGEPAAVTALDPSRQETTHFHPYFLRDGQHYLFLAWSTEPSNRAIYVGSLDSKERKRLLVAASNPVYAEPGYLFFHREGTVFAQPFNADKRELTGEPVRIADQVDYSPVNGGGSFRVSQNGVLIYRTGAGRGNDLQFAWFDRAGKPIEKIGTPGSYHGLDLSPDGKRLAVHRHDGNGGDIWTFESDRGTTSRLTFDPTRDNSYPIWSPDGNRIVFGSRRNDKVGLYAKPADGTGNEELLVESDLNKMPASWSPDGKFIVYSVDDPKTGFDVWALPLDGDRKPFPLLQRPFPEAMPRISPDGKWIAYAANEGRVQIYIRPFPSGPGKWQISVDGGVAPKWRRDGRELYFLSGANGVGGKMMAVDIHVDGSSIQAGIPHELFDSGLTYAGPNHRSGSYNPYDVSADGQRFLIARPAAATADTAPAPITVVVNWTAALRK